MDVDCLDRYRFPKSASGREVVRAGDPGRQRTVVLLHELGGLSQPTVDYAALLVDAGCVVHMPLIFGSVGQQSAVKGMAQLCWGRQLTMLVSDRRSRIAGWLGEFCDHLHSETGRPVVVIGMCATGGVVFSVLMRDSVGGAVAAQPSLPFRPPWTKSSISSFGASAAEVTASAASGKPIAALRFREDVICPAGRLVQIGHLFGEDSLVEVPGKGHSTLVYDHQGQAHDKVVELLEDVFGGSAAPL